QVLDVNARRERQRLPLAPEWSLARLSFDPAGTWIAIQVAKPGPTPPVSEGKVIVWDPARRDASAPVELPAIRQSGRGFLVPATWSPDGSRLAVWGEEATGGITVYDPATGKAVLTVAVPPTREGLSLVPTGLTYSPDGKRLASVLGALSSTV